MAQRILRRSSPHLVPEPASPPSGSSIRRGRAGGPSDLRQAGPKEVDSRSRVEPQRRTAPSPGTAGGPSVGPSGNAPLAAPQPPDLARPDETPPGLSSIAIENLRRYDDIIERYGRINGLDANLIRAVIYVESAGDHKAVSHKGARGLMQLMPGTASDMGVVNAFDPSQNIFGGTRYLSSLVDRFERVDLALWAYNAGPESVKRRRLPMETKRYIPEVLRVKSVLDDWGL